MVKLSAWIRDDHCCYRYILGRDPLDVKNRVAFIEKTPRVRIKSFTDYDLDCYNWISGFKGSSSGYSGDSKIDETYGFYQPSRDWCDAMLILMKYVLPTDRNVTFDESTIVEYPEAHAVAYDDNENHKLIYKIYKAIE